MSIDTLNYIHHSVLLNSHYISNNTRWHREMLRLPVSQLISYYSLCTYQSIHVVQAIAMWVAIYTMDTLFYIVRIYVAMSTCTGVYSLA